MFLLGITEIGDPNILHYAEDVSKTDMGPMSVDKKIQTRQPVTIRKLFEALLSQASG